MPSINEEQKARVADPATEGFEGFVLRGCTCKLQAGTGAES